MKHGFLVMTLICIWAQNKAHTAEQYRVNVSQTVAINEHSENFNVTNSCAKDIMVPTKTSNEWLNFRNNKPSCISLEAGGGGSGSCTCSCIQFMSCGSPYGSSYYEICTLEVNVPNCAVFNGSCSSGYDANYGIYMLSDCFNNF
jgi:hypothetical protein